MFTLVPTKLVLPPIPISIISLAWAGGFPGGTQGLLPALYLGITLGSAQDLLLFLCSSITHDEAQGTTTLEPAGERGVIVVGQTHLEC